MTRAKAVLAAGAVIMFALSLAPAAAIGTAAKSPVHLFGAGLLLPGQSEHDTITMPAADLVVRPYLQITDLRQTCGLLGACPAGTPSLAGIMMLTVADKQGSAITSSLAGLQRRVALPGGTLAARQARTYALTLSLPAQAGDAYENMTVSADLIWDGKVAATLGVVGPPPGAGVLGEHIGRHPHGGSSSPQGGSVSNQGGSLPFTGLDVLSLLATALGLVGLGGGLVVFGRRRRAARLH